MIKEELSSMEKLSSSSPPKLFCICEFVLSGTSELTASAPGYGTHLTSYADRQFFRVERKYVLGFSSTATRKHHQIRCHGSVWKFVSICLQITEYILKLDVRETISCGKTILSFHYIKALNDTDSTSIKKRQFLCNYLIVAKPLKVRACQNIYRILCYSN